MKRVLHPLDRIQVTFDDPSLVSNPGLLLGLEPLICQFVRLAGRVGGARPGRKVLTQVHAMVAGASHIDHADVLRRREHCRRIGAPGHGTFRRWARFCALSPSGMMLAHNLIRWTAMIGQVTPVLERRVARTLRQQLIAIPGRLVNHAGTLVLRAPINWPWRDCFNHYLDALRVIEPVPVRTPLRGRTHRRRTPAR